MMTDVWTEEGRNVWRAVCCYIPFKPRGVHPATFCRYSFSAAQRRGNFPLSCIHTTVSYTHAPYCPMYHVRILYIHPLYIEEYNCLTGRRRDDQWNYGCLVDAQPVKYTAMFSSVEGCSDIVPSTIASQL
eukprot:scaffold380418_cov31-Prasinocladus_malaysianus.AAC.1